MITILGAGGAISNKLVTLLAAKNQPFRLVGRNPKATPGATETLATAPDPLIGKEFVTLAAEECGVAPNADGIRATAASFKRDA